MDPAFEAWLRTVPYDRHWIRRNMAVLRKRFEQQGARPMDKVMPPPIPYDRYSDL